MKLPWLCICGGATGDLIARVASRSNQNSSLRHRHADRRRILAPFGQQRVQRLGLDHRAGQDLRADRRRLLDHADADVGLELLQADREREPGRAGADGHDVVFHGFAFGHCVALRIFRNGIVRVPTRGDQVCAIRGS